MRQRYHQNVQSKSEHDVNSQQNQYDGKKKPTITRIQMCQGHNQKTTEKYSKIGQSKSDGYIDYERNEYYAKQPYKNNSEKKKKKGNDESAP